MKEKENEDGKGREKGKGIGKGKGNENRKGMEEGVRFALREGCVVHGCGVCEK
jgi:hypothetical protein